MQLFIDIRLGGGVFITLKPNRSRAFINVFEPLQQTQSQRGSVFKMMTVRDGEKNIIRSDLNKSPEGNNCAHI